MFNRDTSGSEVDGVGLMRRIDRQRGEGRLSFLLTLAVFGAVIFVAVKIVPVRIAAYEFRDLVREEARRVAVRRDYRSANQRLMRAAKEMELPIKNKAIEVRQNSREVVIRASYEQPVDLKVYTYVYKFEAEERAPLF